jgi:transposase-like protein
MRKRKTYSAEQKAKAVIALLRGDATQVEIARNLGCHPNLLAKWQSALITGASTVFASAQEDNAETTKIAELERMVGKLTVQLEFLKKVSGRMD